MLFDQESIGAWTLRDEDLIAIYGLGAGHK